MAVDWIKQVIDNKDLKDSDVITLGGGQTVAIGDIRSLTKNQLKALGDRETALAAQEASLKKNLETLQAAQAETARLFTDLQNQKNQRVEKVSDNQPDPLEALERDPVIGPLAKAIRQQNNVFEEFKKQALGPIAKAQQDMAAVYVRNRIEDLYDRVVPDTKKGTVTLDALLKVANDNGLKDGNGIPDVRKAYQHLTTKPVTQEDLDAQLKAAREEGKKEAMEAARLRVPRPGIGNVGGRPESEFKPNIRDNTTVSSALSEAIAAAAKDADIWANVDNGISN